MLSGGTTENELIFLSYSSPDCDAVREFHDYLYSRNYNVWFDKRKLKPGQNWDFEIKRALKAASIIVVFISNCSVDRRGYAQREIRLALEQAETRLVDDIYVIPVLLDPDVVIPQQIADIQVIRATEEDRFEVLTSAIDHQFERMEEQNEKAQIDSNLRWYFSTFSDKLEALPGYDIRYRLMRLSSNEYPQVGEITDILRGDLQRAASECRKVLFEQYQDNHDFGQERYSRQNTWEASCDDPRIVGRMLSVIYSFYWYNCGAAHPNSGFSTYNFCLNPLVQFSKVDELFDNPEYALPIIQESVRKQLLAVRPFEEDTGDYNLEEAWVVEGTKDWSCFSNFAFSQQGVDFLFAPYDVAPYAFGPQEASVPYADIAPLLRREIASILDVQHLRNRLQIEQS